MPHPTTLSRHYFTPNKSLDQSQPEQDERATTACDTVTVRRPGSLLNPLALSFVPQPRRDCLTDYAVPHAHLSAMMTVGNFHTQWQQSHPRAGGPEHPQVMLGWTSRGLHEENHNSLFNQHPIGLPEHVNCAFWATLLPRDVTVQEICDAIRDCGRIYKVDITREMRDKHNRDFASASIEFFDPDAAQRFHDQAAAKNGPRLFIRGQEINVMHDWNRGLPHTSVPSYHTRVLFIKGHRTIVNERYLTDYFRDSGIRFQIERIVNLHCHRHEVRSLGKRHVRNLRKLEVRFASYDGQAILAYMLLRQDPQLKHLNPPLFVDFDDDLCDVRCLSEPDMEGQDHE